MNREKILENVLSIVLILSLLAQIFTLPILLWMAILLGFLSLLSSLFALCLAQIWAKCLHVIARGQAFLILSIFYFIILSPLAWLKNLLNKDPLQIRKPKRDSYFKDRNYTYKPEDFEKLW